MNTATQEKDYLNHEFRVHDLRYPLSRLRAEELGERDWDEGDKWFTGIYPEGVKDKGPERDYSLKFFIKEYIEGLPGFDGWENYNITWDVLWYGTERYETFYIDSKGKRNKIHLLRWTVAHHDLPRQVIKPLQIIKKEVRVTYTKKKVRKEEQIYFESQEMKKLAQEQLEAYPEKQAFIDRIEDQLKRLEAQAKRNLRK